MTVSRTRWLSALMVMILGATPAMATIPYTSVPVFGPPVVGPLVQPPSTVYGKEYSHDKDLTTAGGGGIGDPQQVIAWDGIGGTADTIDYTGTRPGWPADQEVDAIANSRDSLFDETLRDESHLIFSHDDVIGFYGSPAGVPLLKPVSSGGPVIISNGNAIGGAGEVSVEEAGAFGAFSSQFTWATQPEVNGMPRPDDVDGLEVWGPEPFQQEPGLPVPGDADKYSLDTDLPSGVSIWNASGSPYMFWPTIVSAVETLLGPAPADAFDLRDGVAGREAINLDALMVSDVLGETETFDQDVAGLGIGGVIDQSGVIFEPMGPDGGPRGDSIIFSIRQIVDPTDPDGYYATGSELFVIDSFFGVSFLTHGGHVWDQAHSISDLTITIPGGPLPGDANADGKVDLLDLDILGMNFGKMPAVFADGDFNGDGKVDLLDLDILGTNFGAMGSLPDEFGVIDINAIEAIGIDEFFGFPAGGVNSAAVPEPTAAVLAALALTAGVIRRRG